MHMTSFTTCFKIIVLSLGSTGLAQTNSHLSDTALTDLLNPPADWFPMTNNGTTVRIPDLAMTQNLLFRIPVYQSRLDQRALDFLNHEVPISAQSQALYGESRKVSL